MGSSGVATLYLSFLLFKLMERECRAMVCSWCCSLLILVGGTLNCWERMCQVLTWMPPLWPIVKTSNGWTIPLAASMALIRVEYL